MNEPMLQAEKLSNGDLLILRDGAPVATICIEWFHALRKYLNEGMVERWVMQQAGGSMYPYDTEAEACKVAKDFTKIHGEDYRAVRILVPVEEGE